MTRTYPLMPEPAIAGQSVLAPKLWVYVGQAGQWTRYPTAAIVDTGSPVTLMATEIAHACGVSKETIAAGEAQEFEGLGGGEPLVGHLVNLDLALVADQRDSAGEGLILRGCRVFVADGQPELILGQHDFLERLRFEQRNYEPERTFALEPVQID